MTAEEQGMREARKSNERRAYYRAYLDEHWEEMLPLFCYELNRRRAIAKRRQQMLAAHGREGETRG